MAVATAEHPSSVAPAKGTPLISMRNIQKHFGSLHALRGASVEVHAGEVVALVGHNGAGKSTLVKVMAGVHTADSGEYLFEGKPVRVSTPTDATDLGPPWSAATKASNLAG